MSQPDQDGFRFTSESVTEGHPDKIADQISDAVAVEKVLISTQHREGAEDKLPDALWTEVVTAVLPDDLYDPADLRATAAYGHFGRTEESFTWERTDVAGRLREQAGLA